MCANMEDGCCANCSAAAEPELMKRMVHALGVDGMLSAPARAAAAERCGECADKEICEHWLPVAELRGADHAPSFCANKDTFDALASEAPATL